MTLDNLEFAEEDVVKAPHFTTALVDSINVLGPEMSRVRMIARLRQ